MAEQPTDEQIKEFWERYKVKGKLASIEAVEGSEEGKLVYESPPIDLDNLFRWAVPKAVKAIGDKYQVKDLTAFLSLMNNWGDLCMVENRTRLELDPIQLFWVLRRTMEASNDNR